MRVFTVREANRILPQVEQAIRSLRARAREIIGWQDRLGVLSLIGAEDSRSPEHAELGVVQKELEDSVNGYNEHLEELQRIGCVVKDLNHGLVDFYGRSGDRLVFLCWRLGEKKIAFWHELQGGFSGRRPIKELEGAEEETGD